MGFREKRIKEFILPTRIVKTEGHITNAERLLTGFEQQNFFKIDKPCTVKGKGYIILDFGREIYGSIRIMMNIGRKYLLNLILMMSSRLFLS